MKKRPLFGIISIAVVVVALLIAPKKKTTDVDIMTGQISKTWRVWPITIRGKTQASPISKLLTPAEINAVTPKWKPVFSEGGSGLICWCGHPTYHGAISDIDTWEMLWKVEERDGRLFPDGIPEGLKSKTAKDILALWQAGGSDDLVDHYLGCLIEMMLNGEENAVAQLETLKTLAVVQTTTNSNEISTTFFYPNGRPMRYERIVNPLDIVQ